MLRRSRPRRTEAGLPPQARRPTGLEAHADLVAPCSVLTTDCLAAKVGVLAQVLQRVQLLGCSDGTYWIDAKRAALVGERQHSWLSGEEILAALPVAGMRRHLVPLGAANRLAACGASLNQWNETPGIFEDHVEKQEASRLVAVSARPEAITLPNLDAMPVDCTWDFSEHIAHFTNEVRS